MPPLRRAVTNSGQVLSPGTTYTWTSLGAQLRLACMHELRDAPRRLNLVDDPEPVADRLHRHRGSLLTSFEKLPQRPALMHDPLLPDQLTVRSHHRRERVALVRIERDIPHRLRLLWRLPPPSVPHAHGDFTV